MVAQIPDIAIVLCDVVMPGDIDGRELGKRVMASHPRMRILLMSGYSEGANPANPGNRGDLGDQGDPPLLAKPFIRQQLAQALQTRARCRQPLLHQDGVRRRLSVHGVRHLVGGK